MTGMHNFVKNSTAMSSLVALIQGHILVSSSHIYTWKRIVYQSYTLHSEFIRISQLAGALKRILDV